MARHCLWRACLFILSCTSGAYAAVINFDQLGDGEVVTSQFAAQGVLFENAIALTAGISLNEFEFPPRSYQNVMSDFGGPLYINFSSPQSQVSGFFTYIVSLTMQAFDASDNLVGTASSSSSCVTNMAISGTLGCAPSELLSVQAVGLIYRLRVTGGPDGESFVLDDLTFTARDGGNVPEVSSFALVASGLSLVCLGLRGRIALKIAK